MYTVVSAYSLWRIAARLLGDGRRYPDATGQIVTKWVRKRTHKVTQIEKDKVLLGWPDGIASWLPIDGVRKI